VFLLPLLLLLELHAIASVSAALNASGSNNFARPIAMRLLPSVIPSV
jgi:hypothetical protein